MIFFKYCEKYVGKQTHDKSHKSGRNKQVEIVSFKSSTQDMNIIFKKAVSIVLTNKGKKLSKRNRDPDSSESDEESRMYIIDWLNLGGTE